MDRDWAIQQLDHFLRVAELYKPAREPGNFSRHLSNRGTQDEILDSAQVVEQVIDRALPDWRTSVPSNVAINKWYQHIEAAKRARVQLQRQEELAEKLGDNAPRLSASHLHPWVWDSAKPLWSNGHYREAVTAAARAVNAYTQAKVGRRDVSEAKLFQQAFATAPPEPGKPRLRIMADDGSDTYKSVHTGALNFAGGLYGAIRNPASHVMLDELPEDEALEQLAAFSVLARWVDRATLDAAGP
ncbi:TIGR02391 family protein [Polymorphospora rubra]|uniref:Conserved hypothetical protein CHP02391 domain-containing protein n=1 Tax=Polymorphospora rubra TaxID=338584 RepID=A0A810N0D9_9ACTN|nr:TIGR02391 family protein [Polymorphospora rubra]BCJ65118.1 hypothetical protein Prubr_21390 [Polymorphospora rubra]